MAWSFEVWKSPKKEKLGIKNGPYLLESKGIELLELYWLHPYFVSAKFFKIIFFRLFFFQIQLALGPESSVAVGWQKKEEKMSASGELKVGLDFLFKLATTISRKGIIFFPEKQ